MYRNSVPVYHADVPVLVHATFQLGSFFLSRVMYVDLHSPTIFEATGILFCFEDCSFLLTLKPEPSNILLLT